LVLSGGFKLMAVFSQGKWHSTRSSTSQ
jgi:hypothetical protein